jgi:hypothetical protein
MDEKSIKDDNEAITKAGKIEKSKNKQANIEPTYIDKPKNHPNTRSFGNLPEYFLTIRISFLSMNITLPQLDIGDI